MKKANGLKKSIRILTSIVIVLYLFIIVLTIYQKNSEQINYANNTQETKNELSNELPICKNGSITSDISNENKVYKPDELMGSIYIPKFELVIPIYMENEDDSSNWALEIGVAMDNSSSYPYGSSSIVEYGHRHYGFQALKDVEVGDGIIVSIGENIYLYEVTGTEIVDETQVTEVCTNENAIQCFMFIE